MIAVLVTLLVGEKKENTIKPILHNTASANCICTNLKRIDFALPYSFEPIKEEISVSMTGNKPKLRNCSAKLIMVKARVNIPNWYKPKACTRKRMDKRLIADTKKLLKSKSIEPFATFKKTSLIKIKPFQALNYFQPLN